MIKYLNEIIISIFISIVVSGLIVYTTGNIIAGVSVFTAVLVTINFIINRYEMRNEATVDFMLTTGDKKNPIFSVSLVNTGGKVIYVDTIGLKTKDGTIIDFDEDVKDEEPLPQPEKPKRGLYDFPIFKMPVFESFKLPKIRSNNFYTINPGDRRRDSKEVNDVIKILNHKKYHYQDTIEFQGIFIDRLGCEHVSGWKQFTLKELLTR